METNLVKAKRLLKAHLLEREIHVLEDGFIMRMLDLAATPDKTPTITIRASDYDDPYFTVG